MKVYLQTTGKIGKHILYKRMLPYWKKMGCKVKTESQEKCDLYIATARISEETDLPIVLRLDQAYYDVGIHQDRNKTISDAHSRADGIIYQSNYAKVLCEKYLTEKKEGAISTIIYNGIDEFWCGKHDPADPFNIITVANWSRMKRLPEIISIFLDYHSSNPDSFLHVIGDLRNNVEVSHPNIIYYGPLAHNNPLFISAMRMANLALYFNKRDACSNFVVESIGMGIPVITTKACGGASEICSMTYGCYTFPEDDNMEPVDPLSENWNRLDSIRKITKCMAKIDLHRYRVKMPELLKIEEVSEQYFNFFKLVI